MYPQSISCVSLCVTTACSHCSHRQFKIYQEIAPQNHQITSGLTFWLVSLMIYQSSFCVMAAWSSISLRLCAYLVLHICLELVGGIEHDKTTAFVGFCPCISQAARGTTFILSMFNWLCEGFVTGLNLEFLWRPSTTRRCALNPRLTRPSLRGYEFQLPQRRKKTFNVATGQFFFPLMLGSAWAPQVFTSETKGYWWLKRTVWQALSHIFKMKRPAYGCART